MPSALSTILRGSIFGGLVYVASGKRLFLPRIYDKDYVIPSKYLTESPYEKEENRDEKKEGNESLDSDEIIVTFDGDDDPERPMNWPTAAKVSLILVLGLSSLILYMGAAIYTPAEEEITTLFGTTLLKSTLGLSLFVWGYGFGAWALGPMTEIPVFGGRNYAYFISQFLFTILQIPTPLVHHIASFSVLRFLAGLFAGPGISTVAASYQDVVGYPGIVFLLIIWAFFVVVSPFLGPLIGGALMISSGTWQWTIWFLLIVSGAVTIGMFFFLPESSEQIILMNKARHLRHMTGNPKIVAPGDIENRKQTWGYILRHIFWLPLELLLKEYVLFVSSLHLALVYGLFYLFFEAFPTAYGEVYHFSLIAQGCAYLSLLVGVLIAAAVYATYLQKRLISPLNKGAEPEPTHVFGDAAIVGSILCPAGFIIFGWTASPLCHWFGSLVGNTLCAGGIFLLFMTYVAQLSNLYIMRFSSVMAVLALTRSTVAGGMVLAGRRMYTTLAVGNYPVGWGCTLIAFIAIPLTGMPIYMRMYGVQLKAKTEAKYGNIRQ